MSERGAHETRDLPARVPVYAIAFTAVTVPLGALAMWLLMETVWQEAPQPPPLFPEESPSETRAPPLQQSPPADMAELERDQEGRLSRAGWVDREAGVVHLPIDRAMELTVERGLPGPQSGAPPSPARDAATEQQPGNSP